MYPIKKVLVGLDQSEMDPTLIKFASFIAKSSPTTDICFVNVIRDLNVPEEIKKKFPELAGSASIEKATYMRKIVEEHLDPSLKVNLKFITKQGMAAKKILKTAREEGIDMVVIGRKRTLKGSGVLSQRLARRVECSLLIVPESSEPQLKKVLVPSDFSDYSIIAMEEAVAISERRDFQVEVICQNVFTVPAGYHYTGKSYEEFALIMEKNAKSDYKKFIKKIDTKAVKIKPVYSLDSDEDPVEDIYQMAKKTNADSLIIGARGRTSATALFLGSMAERLIQKNFDIPVLIVRHKGRNAGLMDYLKEI